MSSLIIAALLGIMAWTLLEYGLHRGLGHIWRKNRFGRDHTRHHAEVHWFASTIWKLVTAVIVGVITAPIAIFVAGLGPGLAFTAGLLVFYGVYEWLHRRAHTRAPLNRYGAWLRRHHFWHHFGDTKVNHGVTTPIWDYVFGTHATPDAIRVPRKVAMPWLVDDAGEIQAPYRAHYVLRGR